MKQIFEDQLQELLSTYQQSSVKESIEYSLLAPGKRIRPLLLMSLLKDYGIDPVKGIEAAMALEMIHTYSLIHDDLPVMDNDDLRRGKPTNHIIYGEAIALLAGDGLLTGAFEVLSDSIYTDYQKVQLIQLYAKLSGINGMVLGQNLDLAFEKTPPSKLNELLKMYELKSGCLLSIALEAAAIIAGRESDRMKLSEIGLKCGRAFQIQDDIFDKTKSSQEIGKTSGSDEQNQKSTIFRFLSLEQATELMLRYYEEIRESLAEIKPFHSELGEIVEYLISRQK